MDYLIKRNKSNISIELSELLFLDVETSGLNPNRGAFITEIAILDRYKVLFYWKIAKKNSLKLSDNILKKILQTLTQGIVVGHNCHFDFDFIFHEAERKGLDIPMVHYIDTMELSRKILDTPNLKLSTLLNYFDIRLNGQLHTANVDAQATRALFWKLVSKANIYKINDANPQRLLWSKY